MKIEVTDIFKSVRQFTWDSISSLSIITGLNGAGKSQLLELITVVPERCVQKQFKHPNNLCYK
jgi:predicted ATPase